MGFKLPSSMFRKVWYFLEAVEPHELQRWHQFSIYKHRKYIRKFRNTSISSLIVRLVNMQPSVTLIVPVTHFNPNITWQSYVYWTVHHLHSWIKRDQLDVTCFIISLFNAQHVSDVNTSFLRSLRLICWVISLVLQPAYGYHTTTAKPQCNTNTHQTRAIQPMK